MLKSSRPWSSLIDELQFDGYDIRRYDPTLIANELTLINRNLLMRIKPIEFVNLAFLSIEKERLAPNVTQMLEFSDRISALFATQILRERTDRQRVSVLMYLFQLIQRLYTVNHDIHSIRLILAALDDPSIFRLRSMWRMFRQENPKFYIALKYLWNILSQQQNWDEYRTWLEEKFIKDCRRKRQPMLIFIGSLISKMIVDYHENFRLSIDETSNPIDVEQVSLARVHSSLIQWIHSVPKRLQ